MKLKRFTVSFGKQDMSFLKKFGLFRAARKVKKHLKNSNIPFIYDTYQLAYELGLPRKELFLLSKNPTEHYKLIMLRKSGGGLRYINAPDKTLKGVQKRILKKILNNIEVSPYAIAYIDGKKLRDNAEPHIKHKYLLKMDITDFFGSITYFQVVSSVFNKKRFPVQIGAMLTSLCCLEEVVPQGAPTSPMISNIVMKSFDDAMGGWCKKRGITYTRYCDDLTFSADTPLYGVYKKAEKMLYKRGFEVNELKTKFISNASSQRVTGLVVNEKVSVPKEYKKQLRQELYYAVKYGLADSIIKGNKTEFLCRGNPDIVRYYNQLIGKLNYLLQIEEDVWFVQMKEKLKSRYYREIKN